MSGTDDIMASAPEVQWTKPMAKRFRKALHKAMQDHYFNKGPDNFDFEGHKYAVQFAVYLLTHLEEKFGISKPKQ